MSDLLTALQRLYDNETNLRISCFQDCGWMVQLGDGINGNFAQRNFSNDELGDVVRWIEAECSKPRVYKTELEYAVEHALQPLMGSTQTGPKDGDAEVERITAALDSINEVKAAVETQQQSSSLPPGRARQKTS